jgi:hypothetical protein
MSEGTKALRAVKLWDAWGRALARGTCDLAALVVDDAPRISASKPATRLRVSLRHHAAAAQLTLELRVDFAGAPRAEIEVDGVVHRESAAIDGENSSEWSAVAFGSKYVEFRRIHEAVPKLMDAVYARSTFLPQLPQLTEVARITGLETAVDLALGAAQRVHFELRQGKDERLAFARMDFELTDGRGEPFTDDDEKQWEDRHGPNAGWPRGVAWRRGDDIIANDTASFGARAGKIFPR